jgi:hypothetical protein
MCKSGVILGQICAVIPHRGTNVLAGAPVVGQTIKGLQPIA